MAPGDVVRQSTELASTLALAQQNPTSSNRLRYALALGAAGHWQSNPVEAKRLITELLAGENDLTPLEISLANVFQREYDARVALYADLARQREESERQTEVDRRGWRPSLQRAQCRDAASEEGAGRGRAQARGRCRDGTLP